MNVINFDQDLEDFIDSLDRDTYSRVLKTTDLLRTFGQMLRMPYSKALGSGLFELRIRGQREIRIFYAFYNQEAVLLHGFSKKTQKTPNKEIALAQDKLKELLNIKKKP